MNVVFLMASDAHAGRTLRKELLNVTLLAFQLTVLLHQRIAGLFRVIEVVPFPGLGRMTDFAFFAEVPLVIVVFFMTVVACRGGVLEKGRFVTLGTTKVPMFVQELKTRFLVIEFLNILPAFFRVTPLAGIAQSS